MVLTVIKGLGKAYLTGKGKKVLGGKTVADWKRKMKHKKYLDSIRDAGHEITGNLKKSAEKLQKLNETLKKQKKILDD